MHATIAASLGAQAQAMLDGRHADSARRRQRVITALDRALTEGAEINASGIAHAAGVDRSFLYRHRDLLEKIHALATEPPTAGEGASHAVTRASLQADLLAAHERAARLHTRVQHLEKRLSYALGEQAWRESGLGTQSTSTRSSSRSPTSSSKSLICTCNATNATRTSPPPAPPTANSWPASTHLTPKGEPHELPLHHTCRTR
jgi:hypothetical protein